MGRGAALRTRSDQRLPQGACGFPGNIPPPGNWPGCDNVQGAAGAATAVTGFRRSYTCNHTFCPGLGTCRASCKSSRLKPLRDRLAQGTQPTFPVTVG